MDRLTRADYAACLRLIAVLEESALTHAFSARQRDRLEALRPHLAFLFRHALNKAGPLSPEPASGITVREQEVLRWVATGKTDGDIARLLAISPRTVHKHLEHIYVKLGVETRTAAVMRARVFPEGLESRGSMR